MAIDFGFKRTKQRRLAVIDVAGPYSEGKIRAASDKLENWAQARKVRTGAWVVTWRRDFGARVGVEVGRVSRGGDGVRIRSIPGGRVASITFDPEALSPRVPYHGLTDWLRQRRKEGDIKRTGLWREVYLGNPWKNSRAWSRCEVQVEVG